MTSLYQVALRGKVVETVTPKHKKVKRYCARLVVF